MSADFVRCDKCGYAPVRVFTKCPQCGKFALPEGAGIIVIAIIAFVALLFGALMAAIWGRLAKRNGNSYKVQAIVGICLSILSPILLYLMLSDRNGAARELSAPGLFWISFLTNVVALFMSGFLLKEHLRQAELSTSSVKHVAPHSSAKRSLEGDSPHDFAVHSAADHASGAGGRKPASTSPATKPKSRVCRCCGAACKPSDVFCDECGSSVSA